MKNSSLGRSGREGMFTMDHDRGIINTHEEVFYLGRGFGIIETAGSTYKLVAHPALHESLSGYLNQKLKNQEPS